MCDDIYRQALECAKKEYDELQPKMEKMKRLRVVINNLSSILGEKIEDKYAYQDIFKPSGISQSKAT